MDSKEHEVKDSNESVTLRVTWPPGVVASMTITFWSQGKTPPEGSIIEPMVGTNSSSLEGLVEDPLKGSRETLLFEEWGNRQTAQIVRQHVAGGMPIRLVG